MFLLTITRDRLHLPFRVSTSTIQTCYYLKHVGEGHGLIVCLVVVRSALGDDHGTHPDAMDMAVEHKQSGEPEERNDDTFFLQSMSKWECGCGLLGKPKTC